MGPPIRIDGNLKGGGTTVAWIEGFNGAADSHRRKPQGARSSGDTRTELQWGRRFASTETRRARLGALAVLQASMGPPIRIDGNTSRPGTRWTPPPGFNGAADSHRRKLLARSAPRTLRTRFNGAADSHRRKPQGWW